MFRIGDQVVHPMHGAGVIDDIVREKVTGSMKEYYVFKMPVGGLILKIPTANCQTIGIRSVSTPSEVESWFGGVNTGGVGGQTKLYKRKKRLLELSKP